MHKSNQNIIGALRKKWLYKAILSRFFLAIGLAMIIYSVLYTLYALPPYVLGICFLIVFALTFLFDKATRLSDVHVSRFLDLAMPSLEESTGLLLRPRPSLNLLEKFQAEKIEDELKQIKDPDPFRKRLVISVVIFLVSSSISLFLLANSTGGSKGRYSTASTVSVKLRKEPEIVLPAVKTINLTIQPPAYTGRGFRKQDRFNLIAEEGSNILWEIGTNRSAKGVKLVFNDGSHLSLTPDVKGSFWRAKKQVARSGFYQVEIDSEISELYKIETIKDQPPVVIIETPQSNTSVKFNAPEAIFMRGRMSDDYGIQGGYISATVSSGQGEGVTFKEQRWQVGGFRAGQSRINIQESLNWRSLGMKPGDELYFYITATDSRKQETRSPVYIITLEDTSSQSSMNGTISPLDVQQELFRSQRQIIIETEQLLKNKSRISADEFVKKSNNLGIDQKLLRMRYGKFLGEETDVEIGEEHEHHDGDKMEDPQSIIDQYSHLHDNAEDASFFDSATKKQLKATLAEMWKAEINLRTIKPRDALPFEYKALALLKDLQQKSRVYVAKTGIKTTPIQPDKRLTGELNKITQPLVQTNVQKKDNGVNDLRLALSILEMVKVNGHVDPLSEETLQRAFYQLSLKAADAPSVFIPSLSAFKKVLANKYRLQDINQAQVGLQKMVAAAENFPSARKVSGPELSREYFNQLKANRP